MAGTEGALQTGAYGLNDIPSALLKYDRDKDYSGVFVYINREIATLTYLIREKLPKVKVSSHEPTLPEVTERAYKFNLASNGPTGTSGVMTQTWTFSNETAKNFQKNDYLEVDGIFFDGVQTWSTSFSPTSGPREIVRILDIGIPGTTNTQVTVQRGIGGNGSGTPAQVTTSMNLILATSAAGEASRSRMAIGKNIVTDTNYVQLFREPYEATDFEMDEDLFFSERPEQVNANLAAMLLLKKLEFTFWAGRKTKTIDPVTNRVLYTTGGIAEFIPKDSDHHINVGQITATSMNNILKNIIKLGGSSERWLIGGYSFITMLNNAYADQIRLNMPMTERYGLHIKTLESSIGGAVHVLPSFALTELGADNEAYVLDLGDESTPYFQYMYMDDIYINTGPDGKGIQYQDEFVRKEEFVAKVGLLRRASQYQVHLYGAYE